jgi:eukaryotic-like serine/threonine-protein kinase
VTPNLEDRLATSLGSTYSLERELGGGGMSRVFLADETSLGRPVVIKVLSPELAEGLSAERFEREIRVAARLQQANIVPVLRSGDIDGLPYYTMPFVAGESLRARLADGSLNHRDAIAILRDVAKALAHAHAAGVVHRDIKPENVLLSGGTAVVTDFGIAKAISASRGRGPEETGGLTALGTSLGTPAYMAPEQAAGDPDADARVDVYAWGVLAYELLAGRHPFDRYRSTHELVRAHISEVPAHLSSLAPDIPADIAALVMLCLAKNPDERPQSATEMLAVLDRAQPSGAGPAVRPPLGLGPALAIYAVVFVAVVAVARVSTTLIGLPTWVVGGSFIVMALGLPVVLLTALIERQRARPIATPSSRGTIASLAVRYPSRFTWRRTSIGGLVAFGVLMLGVAAYMGSWKSGVGPFGSLIGSQALAASDRILIGSLRGPEDDSNLGDAMAEGMRADLSQSRAVRLVSTDRVRMLLAQMEQAGAPVVGDVARELAERAGAKAILDGEVRKIGSAYALTVRLLPARGGDPLVTLQETAKDDADFTAAAGRLSRRLRARVGESLRSVNSAPPLFAVTTPSLAALRKYTEAMNASRRGDFFGAITLAREAVAIDSGFVSAHMLIGSTVSFISGMRQAQSEALERAYAARARATPLERYLVEYHYWNEGPTPDLQRAAAAAQAAYAIDPEAAAYELGTSAFSLRDFERAITLVNEAVRADSARIGGAIYAAMAHAELGRIDSARSVIQQVLAYQPGHPGGLALLAQLRALSGDYAGAAQIGEAIEAAAPVVEWGAFVQGGVAELTGRLRDVDAAYRRAFATMGARGVASARTAELTQVAYRRAAYHGDSAGAARLLDSIVRLLLPRVPPRERPYDELVTSALAAGRLDIARAMRDGVLRDDPNRFRANMTSIAAFIEGSIARAEGRYPDAIQAFRRNAGFKPGLAELARTFDEWGQTDSALVYYERYARSTSLDFSLWNDALHLARVRRRLAELYEDRGRNGEAAEQWSALIRQLESADPELQSQVTVARQRLRAIERLRG